MKSFIISFAVVSLLAGMPIESRSQASFGMRFSDGRLSAFYLAIGEYYRVPRRDIVVIHERRIPDDELPVVMYIAECAHVPPRDVAVVRLGGESWADVSMHFGLGPEIFYVPGQAAFGPPYGNAYGYYRHNPHARWRGLTDDVVIDRVNTRFLSEYYHRPQGEIREWRERGDEYPMISARYGRGGDRDDRDFDRRDDRARRGDGDHRGGERGRGNGWHGRGW